MERTVSFDMLGLVALQTAGINVGDDTNGDWRSFAQRMFHRRAQHASFTNALAWHRRHWRR